MFKGFQKPKRLVANTETLTERYGMFIAQPFERGFGSTIGTGGFVETPSQRLSVRNVLPLIPTIGEFRISISATFGRLNVG